MADPSLRQSPFAGAAARFADVARATAGTLSVREIPFLGQVDLRVEPAVVERIGSAAGLVLPSEPNTVATVRDRRALWLGPDEWLVVGPDGSAGEIESRLREALGPEGSSIGSALDVSANRAVVELAGSRARDILEAGCTIDLHPRAFGPGRCAQTLLARAPVLLEQTDEAPTYRLYVRPSLAPYLTAWLLDAAEEFSEG